MFNRILVPLDGSRLAEAALGPAIYLARRSRGTLVLFHVVEQRARPSVHGQPHLTSPGQAKAYLDQKDAALRAAGVVVETDLHTVQDADVAHTIAAHAIELKADLTALCVHGRGGIRNLFVGSIAQQVIQVSATPLLFVGNLDAAAGMEIEQPRWQTILVALDGAAVHEGALPAAAELGRSLGTRLELIQVVPTAGTLSPERAAVGTLLPSTTDAVLDLTQREALAYLKVVVEMLRRENVTSSGTVKRGDAAAEILQAAREKSANLIVLATHARDNWDAFWSGSLTPKILSKSNVPVLLVRVTGDEPAH